jgi:hypothetical protein
MQETGEYGEVWLSLAGLVAIGGSFSTFPPDGGKVAHCAGRGQFFSKDTPMKTEHDWTITRRDFLKASSLAFAGAPFAHAAETGGKIQLRFGMVTDAHYADIATSGTRFYRESTVKLTECVTRMNEAKVDFLIELGDLKDQGTPAVEADTLKYLETIEKVFAQFRGPRYHVLGNHDMDSISKAQFLAGTENTGSGKGAGFYSFDAKGLHCVVLDGNFKADGTDYDHGNYNWMDTIVPAHELEWLRKDLTAASGPVIVFVHQRLDGAGDVYVKNAAEIRQILETSGSVLAVFQGHHHQGGYTLIGNIHYYTLKALIEGSGEENNSYAVVEVDAQNNITVTGYRTAVSKAMNKA